MQMLLFCHECLLYQDVPQGSTAKEGRHVEWALRAVFFTACAVRGPTSFEA